MSWRKVIYPVLGIATLGCVWLHINERIREKREEERNQRSTRFFRLADLGEAGEQELKERCAEFYELSMSFDERAFDLMDRRILGPDPKAEIEAARPAVDSARETFEDYSFVIGRPSRYAYEGSIKVALVPVAVIAQVKGEDFHRTIMQTVVATQSDPTSDWKFGVLLDRDIQARYEQVYPGLSMRVLISDLLDGRPLDLIRELMRPD